VIGAAAAYLGLAIAFIGLLATIHPIRKLRLTSRLRGALLLLTGVIVVAIALSLPARDVHVAESRTRLDEFAPDYQFNEVHAIRIAAAPEQVYQAMRAVTAGEISLFQLLTWLRRFGRPGPESILNAPDRMPLLDVATRTGFLLLADDMPREVVLGTVVLAPPMWRRRDAATPAAFKSLIQPGFAKAAMNFRIEPDGAGASILSTETRVFATDATSRRRFARYWRIIYPGSAIIRRSWLKAIRRRAERT
jgi:hypothetical protein